MVRLSWPGLSRPSRLRSHNALLSEIAGTSPAMTAGEELIQRLELHDRGAVVVADPEGDRVGGVVDEDATDICLLRQQIFDHLSALGIEPVDQVVEHRAGPGL